MHPTTVAVDLAKSVFEVAVADRRGRLQAHHRFTRRQFEWFCRTQAASHVVMDACGMAHHWGRVARRCGHQVSLLPAQYAPTDAGRAHPSRNIWTPPGVK